MPFLNSFWASPRLARQLRSCDPPKRTSTTTAMISHSGAPMRSTVPSRPWTGRSAGWRGVGVRRERERGSPRRGPRGHRRGRGRRPARRAPRSRSPPSRAHPDRHGCPPSRHRRGGSPPRPARHDGVHPRLGVVDVVPFVPLGGLRRWTTRSRPGTPSRPGPAAELGVPSFLYGPAATSCPRCRSTQLAAAATGGVAHAVARPRPPAPHPTAGAICVGARGHSSPTTSGSPSRTWASPARSPPPSAGPARPGPRAHGGDGVAGAA